MEQREERVRLDTAHYRITGTVRLAAGGYRSRLSDALNAPERQFVSLTDVTLEPLDGGTAEQHPFMLVGREHIVLAVSA
jgi:hypothetical protein